VHGINNVISDSSWLRILFRVAPDLWVPNTETQINYSNKTLNQMQHLVVKFIAQSHRCCSTCFGQQCAHYQELFQTAFAASGFRINAEVDVVCLLVTNKHVSGNIVPNIRSSFKPTTICYKPTTAGNTFTSAFIWKPEAATAVWKSSWWWAQGCPKHVEQRLCDWAINFTTKCCIWLGVLIEYLKMHGTINPKNKLISLDVVVVTLFTFLPF
jgi:hypothetical protein